MKQADPGAPRAHEAADDEREPLAPELVRRLPSRDPAALSAFYEAYFDRIYAFVHRLVGRDALAEDLTQDVFVQLQQSISTYDPERPLDPWVFTVASNKVRDFWRSRRHKLERREVALAEDERAEPEDEPSASPSRPMERRELDELLGRAVAELPPSMKSALLLRSEGFTFEEIASMLERKEDAVRKRYSRAIEALRRALAKLPAFDGGPDA